MIALPDDPKNGLHTEAAFSYAIVTAPDGTQYAAFREPLPSPRRKWLTGLLCLAGLAVAGLLVLGHVSDAQAREAQERRLDGLEQQIEVLVRRMERYRERQGR